MSNEIVVCKFGGSSLADAGQIEKARRIVAGDPKRRIVVVSAPGRRTPGEHKITDHLFNVASGGVHLGRERPAVAPEASKKAVLERFGSLISDLGVELPDLLPSMEGDLETELKGDRRVAFLASRGEHYNARVVAAYFGKCGMSVRVAFPEEFGLLVSGEFLDAKVLEQAYDNMAALRPGDEIVVVPGFYGTTRDGEVAVFSRGGSDLTGGELAYALDAAAYENWTDVSGVLEADPGVIPDARAIPRLTFKEIRLLSTKGVNVFHLNAMLRCKERKIPIHIRNTNKPEKRGTVILFERVPEEGVVGIARLDNVAYVYLEKDMLGEEIGFTAELLKIFQEFGVSTYHYPTDKDDIAVLVNQDDLTGSINDLRRRVDETLHPDYMHVAYNLSVLTPVGLGLKNNAFPIVEALSALSAAHVPIEMIDQSPSQICFHIGVQQALADDALRILYEVLINR